MYMNMTGTPGLLSSLFDQRGKKGQASNFERAHICIQR